MPRLLAPSLPTFDNLCRTYPLLRVLAAEAESHHEQGHCRNFCANRAWYDRPFRGQSLRDRVVRIADRAAKRFGQRAYDVAYSGVYDRLPDCRECGCFSREDLP